MSLNLHILHVVVVYTDYHLVPTLDPHTAVITYTLCIYCLFNKTGEFRVALVQQTVISN